MDMDHCDRAFQSAPCFHEPLAFLSLPASRMGIPYGACSCARKKESLRDDFLRAIQPPLLDRQNVTTMGDDRQREIDAVVSFTEPLMVSICSRATPMASSTS